MLKYKYLIPLCIICIAILGFGKYHYEQKILSASNTNVLSTTEETVNVGSEVTPEKKSIAFLGDSLTLGGQWANYFPEAEVFNYGVSGSKTSDIVERVDEALKNQPDSLFLLAGVNDLWNSSPSEDIINNFNSIIDKIKTTSPNTEIYVQSILPIDSEMNIKYFPQYPFPKGTNDTIKNINKELKNIASENNIKYIDLYSLYVNNDKIDSNLTVDGVHLNPEAYDIWANELNSYIQ